MTRPSRALPRIAPEDLRAQVDEAVVARVWERLDADLPARPRRVGRGRGAMLLVAAALGVFGAGVVLGRGLGAAPVARAVPAIERSETDVLAAGEETRTFQLAGGGVLTLSPGATVERQRAGGEITLKLVQGDAKVETSRTRAALLVGDARVNTQAGSTVTVSRRVDNLSVGVTRGGADLQSPSVQQSLVSGDDVSVALHRPVAEPAHTAVASRERGAVGEEHPRVSRHAGDAPHEAVASRAEDQRPATNDAPVTDQEAAQRIRATPGGFDSAIRQATSVAELMRLYDLAKGAARDPAAASGALRRLADEFSTDNYGVLATHRLCQELGAKPEGRKYCERDRQSPLFDAESDACRQLRAAQTSGNKDEAVRVAKEYVKTHADGGQCKDEAARIVAGGGSSDGDDAPAPAPSAESSHPDAGAKPEAKPPAKP